MSEICFIEAKPRIVATGAETTIRLAGGGSDTPYRLAGNDYRAGVVEMPRFRAAFGFDDNGWTGGTIPTSGALGFMPGDSALVTALMAHYWRDAAITVDAGDEKGALSRRLTGTVADIASSDGQISLALADPSKLIDKPLLGEGFAGTGGIEGASEATGRPKRRSWGRVFNVELRLLDKVNNVFEAGDPSKPLHAFDAVYDKGREGSMAVLVWQGSIAATFAALQTSTPAQGGCVAAPSIACVKWWTVPAGPLTADVYGEIAGGYVETAVAIAAKMLATVAGPAIHNQAAADALRPAVCGVHVASPTDTVAQALDRLFLGVSLFWVLKPDATIRIGEWAWKAPVAEFEAEFIGRERLLPPVKSRIVGYRRNHRVHSDSEISAAVITADDVTYLDGTPLEDLKPAEGGAQSNRPPTDNSPAAPLELPHGTMWFSSGGHPYRFGSRPWIGADGTPWIGADGQPWLGGGYEDVQDQAGPEAQAAADAASAAADAAALSAATANASLAQIASDDLLTPGEKPSVILDASTITAEQAGIDAQAAAFGITTEKAAYDGEVAALTAYLATLTAPVAWNALTGNTAIVGATFRSKFANVYAARQTLLNKIAAVAKARGDLGVDLANAAGAAAVAAQADATAALSRVAAIVADGVLDKSEKPDVVLRYNSALSEQPGIQNNAVYYAITTEKTAYDAAVAALTTDLTELEPAYNDYTTDTPVDRAAFNASFKNFYDKRQLLLDKIAVEAGRSTATMVLAPTKFIACDYLGVPKSSDSFVLPNLRKRGNARVDAVSTWSATIPSVITASIDTASANNDRGDITVTALSSGWDNAEIIVTSSNDGIELTGKITLACVRDAPPPPPPPSGTGATSAQSSDGQTNSTASYLSSGVIIGPVRCGSSGNIKLEALLTFSRTLDGENNAYGKWGRATSGSGPFTDTAGGEVISTIGCYRGNTGGAEPVPVSEDGILQVIETVTGLTSGSDYWFEFRPRKGTTFDGSGSAVVTFSGLKKATQL